MPYEPPAFKPSHAAAQRSTYDRAYNRMARGTDPARALAQRVRSSARWRRVRSLQLGRHPLCQDCRGAGRLVPATQVDHVVPLVNDPALAYDLANLRSLCTRCHAIKSGSERRESAATQSAGACSADEVRTRTQVGGGDDSGDQSPKSGRLGKPVFSRVAKASG